MSSHNYEVFTFDATRWDSEEAFHQDIAPALDFPDYYGANVPAFGDSLRNAVADGYIFRPDAAGVVIVMTGYDSFVKVDAQLAWEIIEELAQRARAAMLCGNRLLCLLQSDDPDISFPPVGATAVTWDNAEWFQHDRTRST
ncbi:hypothetical protein GCM10010532_037790 [Dactylosporangium siamense]|uniref:Barstar (barnase inhibitor) domain-containing protein n=1 Tax=Dactylosporangium siamense TaxID=685454 RepID=A0A919UAY0_9ACTN|nr:hypothetical protein Dsi01nite_030220 [Dactylosporangium siamense]